MNGIDAREEIWLLNEAWSGIESDAYFAAREELRNGTPLAYLIGTIPFGPLTIGLESHPLIPRTETEFWVTKVLHELPFTPITILDLCAGSGCIGALALHAFPAARVDFAEIDLSHHNTIRKNLARSNLPLEHTTIYSGNLFEQIPNDARYDLILTNPPYIDPALDRTDANVKTHEPHTALYGGFEGMEIIERIITEAKHYLTRRGILIIEHEPEQCEAIATLATNNHFKATHGFDQFNALRYTTITHTR